MKVVCLHNKGYETSLTIGKTYEVINFIDNSIRHLIINDVVYEYMYIIINDIGNEWWFPKEYFKPLSEIRNEKIDKLLE